MNPRLYTGRLLHIAPSAHVDLKLYLVADAGFGVEMYAGTLRRRFPLLGLDGLTTLQMNQLADVAMDRNILVKVYKGLSPNPEYAVELLDHRTLADFNDLLRNM